LIVLPLSISIFIPYIPSNTLSWGFLGTGEGEFTYGLEHLDVDSNDRVYMVNGANDSEIEVFDTEGNFITKIGDGRSNIRKREMIK
jgi:hypothetical protein